MPRRRRRRPSASTRRRRRLVAWFVAAPLLAFLVAALVGSLIPVNAGWSEPDRGTNVYLASNGLHADLVLPVKAGGLDWTPYFPGRDFADPPPRPRFVAFGAGERGIYLETPRWRDLRPGTALRAIGGGERVLHVELRAQVPKNARAIRLRPHEYRRLWAALRADFRLDPNGRPQRIDHPGYGRGDAFYLATGKISAVRTCNVWAAEKLRLAGVRTSLWPPFVAGLTWRYREAAF